MVAESDSPVKRPGRKAAQVLSSEGEEEDEALTPPRGQVGPRRPASEQPRPGLEGSAVWGWHQLLLGSLSGQHTGPPLLYPTICSA